MRLIRTESLVINPLHVAYAERDGGTVFVHFGMPTAKRTLARGPNGLESGEVADHTTLELSGKDADTVWEGLQSPWTDMHE